MSTDRRGRLGIVKAALCVGLLGTASAAWALPASELREVKILGHHFCTRLDTPTGHVASQDPAKARIIILRVSAEKGPGEARIWAHDFVLRYTHPNGDEDRTSLDAISDAAGEPEGSVGTFHNPEEPSISVKGEEIVLGLSAFLENDVTDIELCRMGAPPTPYHVGKERQMSVYVTSNIGLQKAVNIAADLKKADYYVVTNEALDKDTKGTRVIFAPAAEAQGREIAARLANLLGANPEVKPRGEDIATDYDVLVWLGK